MKTIKFRFHRGSLEESMKTQIEVKTIDELVTEINMDNYFCPELTKDQITIEKYDYDPRINWDTYIVNSRDGVIGFMNGNFEEKGNQKPITIIAKNL